MDWLKKNLVTRITLLEEDVTEGVVDPALVIADKVSSTGGKWQFNKNGLELPRSAFHFVVKRSGDARYVIGTNATGEVLFSIRRGIRGYVRVTRGDYVASPRIRLQQEAGVRFANEADPMRQLAAASMISIPDPWIERLLESEWCGEEWIRQSMRDAARRTHRSYAGAEFKLWSDPDEHLVLADQMEEAGDIKASKFLRRSGRIATIVKSMDPENQRRHEQERR